MARTYADTNELYRVVVLYADDATHTYGPYSELKTARAQSTRVFSEHEANRKHYEALAKRVGFEPRPDFAAPVRTRLEKGAIDWQLVQAEWA